jgi:SAM-dependent methyltransferase
MSDTTAKNLDEFELAYKARLQAGQTKWHPGEFDDFEMRSFLDRMIALSRAKVNECRVLDLGCGTGQVSCYFAGQGATVTAIDCSTSALIFAEQKARERGYKIEFLRGDVRAMDLPRCAYNIVVDCRFLHCVVAFADRSLVLGKVRASLKEGGELWSETMVGVPRIQSGEDFFLDDGGIFWKALPGDVRYDQTMERNGKVLSPIRRIYREIDDLNREFEAAGYEIRYQEKKEPQDDHSVWMVKTSMGVRQTTGG